MKPIFQTALPENMQGPAALPGVAACAPDDWLRVDDAYAEQMAYRKWLMAERAAAVLWMSPEALPAAVEALTAALEIMPAMGFAVGENLVGCPDGRSVALDWEAPLSTLGHLVQQDICLMEKHGSEHVLTGAVLCFPANWRLAEKVMRPLTGIHEPVKDYDDGIARRVQRLFDGVQPERPLWRYNWLPYGDPELHQPNRQDADLPKRFIRSERQCVVRLPKTRAVVFAIHTYVVRRSREGDPEHHLA